MTTTIVMECLTLFLLLCCSAFFSSAETALFSVNPIQIHRLRHRQPHRADLIDRLLAQPMPLLSTVLIGNTLVNVAAAALGYVIAGELVPDYAEAVSIPAMTALLIVFGEVAPKRLAMSHPVGLSVAYASSLATLIKIATPLRIMIEYMTGAFKRKLQSDRKTLTEDEFLTVVEVGEEIGALDREERTMVDGIVALEETQASDVMTPRVDLVGIDLDDQPEEHERVAKSVKFRYLPVYRDTLDQPEGFLDVPRFLLSKSRDIATSLVPPYFVPETAPLDTLLTTFQREHKRVAFVADEFGGTAGLLTRGDILEEIVDDVDNEYGPKKFEIQNAGRNRWLVDGATSLEDINYELGTDLEIEGADRIAGWFSAMAEHIPKTGEVVEAQGCKATVMRIRRQRILLILLEKIAAKPVAEDGNGEEE